MSSNPAMKPLHGGVPRIGIRPCIDGRRRGVREALEVRGGIDRQTPIATVDTQGHIEFLPQLAAQLTGHEQAVLFIHFSRVLSDHIHSPPFHFTPHNYPFTPFKHSINHFDEKINVFSQNPLQNHKFPTIFEQLFANNCAKAAEVHLCCLLSPGIGGFRFPVSL